MKQIIIIGSGGHAKVILSEILLLKKIKVKGFIDDHRPLKALIDKDHKLFNLGKIKNLKSIVDKNTFGVIGVGENSIRKKIVKDVEKVIKNFSWAKIVSKNAIISKNVKIGDGSVIIPGSVINNGTKIGKHCIINTRSSVGHDCFFSDFSSCGPGSTIGGGCRIGKCSYIGIGSTINHKIKIKENTVIGAHSFVNKNCEKNSLYFGVPAKKIKRKKKLVF